MNWWTQILTGADNSTLAIGRVLGIAVALVFLFVVPLAGCAVLVKHMISADEWAAIIDKLTIYVPAILLAVGGTIGLTAPSEPKGDGQ